MLRRRAGATSPSRLLLLLLHGEAYHHLPLGRLRRHLQQRSGTPALLLLLLLLRPPLLGMMRAGRVWESLPAAGGLAARATPPLSSNPMQRRARPPLRAGRGEQQPLQAVGAEPETHLSRAGTPEEHRQWRREPQAPLRPLAEARHGGRTLSRPQGHRFSQPLLLLRRREWPSAAPQPAPAAPASTRAARPPSSRVSAASRRTTRPASCASSRSRRRRRAPSAASGGGFSAWSQTASGASPCRRSSAGGSSCGTLSLRGRTCSAWTTASHRGRACGGACWRLCARARQGLVQMRLLLLRRRGGDKKGSESQGRGEERVWYGES